MQPSSTPLVFYAPRSPWYARREMIFLLTLYQEECEIERIRRKDTQKEIEYEGIAQLYKEEEK